jgi:hypothetical protein
MDHESLFWAYFAVERQGGYGANPSSHQRCEAVGCRQEHVEELKGGAAYLSHTGNGQACRVNSLPRRASIEEEHFESTTPIDHPPLHLQKEKYYIALGALRNK